MTWHPHTPRRWARHLWRYRCDYLNRAAKAATTRWVWWSLAVVQGKGRR